MNQNGHREQGESDRRISSEQPVTPEYRGTPIDPAVLTLDDAFAVLNHRRRRYLLAQLARESELILEELAAKLVAWEERIDLIDVRSNCREQRYVSLYHTHVPKLVDADVIEFDEDEDRITPGVRAAELIDILAAIGKQR
ncbi:hypothetical protein DVK02_07600 [Halobellus sp. Atlit-31R]|nr:hypothetical protein DVK02_07600 [Halobellus sp. Atlit-31R]